jgi:hypothetical protein
VAKKTTTSWRPTAKQISVLEAASETGLNRTITAVCENASVTPKTFYGWLKDDPRFREEWESVWHGAIRKHLPGVVMAQVHKALEGDTRAAEFVAKLGGVFIDKQEQTGEHVIRFVDETSD